jgi:predicted nucleic acid-binding protein
MWSINRQTSTKHDADELHLLAEQASKSVQKLEARARHYTREIARLMAILRQLQAYPVSVEASEVLNEMIEIATQEVPEPPAQPVDPPEPARKPVQNANIPPQKGSVPQRK